MEVTSRFHATVKLNASHEGEVQDGISEEVVAFALKSAVEEVFKEDDEALDVSVTCYIQSFEYKDNIEALRARVRARLDSLDQDSLKELEAQLKEMM